MMSLAHSMPNRGDSSATSATLLGRLRAQPGDSAAWSELVRRYGPRIFAWCRRQQLQDADANDVAQAVLLRLVTLLPEFQYDAQRSFRALLATLARYASADLHARRQRAAPGTGAEIPWDELAARDELGASLQQEYERELLAEAMTRVACRVQPRTWEAFRLTAVEGLRGTAAAERLGMPVTALYVAKSNVQKMLQEEVRRLDT